MILFLLSAALFGCSSTRDPASSKLPWARPASWDGGQQVTNQAGSHVNASNHFKNGQ